MSISRWRRGLVVAGSSLALALGPAAGAAWAHVTVTASDPTRGTASSVITFRVPSEKDMATTAVQVAFPQNTPLPFVTVQSTPGWTVEMTRAPLTTPMVDDDGDTVTQTVSRITWTATAGGIPAETYAEFSVLAEQLPQADTLTFKVLQTYADRSVVSWIDLPTAGGPEPDHPAPILTLASAPPTSSPTTTATSGIAVSEVSAVPAVVTPPAAAAPTGGGAAAPAWAGVVLGALALVVGGLALARSRGPRAR